MKNILKSVGAVLAGFIGVAVLSVATDAILESYGVIAPATDPSATLPWMLVLALFYRSVYTMLCGYLTARLAPFNPMRHVVALMILGGISGLGSVFVGWHYGNHWYPILLALTGPLFVYLGGKLRTR